MIPKQITADDVRAALAEIDRDQVPLVRQSTRYHLVSEGKRYPPKYVVSLAAKYATGRIWPSGNFNGGGETNDFLRGLGFTIENSVTGKIVEDRSEYRDHRNIATRVTAKQTGQRNWRHPERCQECKERVLSLLRSLYGNVETQKRFEVDATPAAFEFSAYSSEILEIFVALQQKRGFAEFVRTSAVPPCDYFVPQPGMIVEFDESQHFTPLRQLTLSRYPSALLSGFDRKEWINLCRQIRASDNDPPFRDEQRAWYDTVRDFLPTIFKLQPTVRLYAGGFGAPGSRTPWCRLNAGDTESFRQILTEHTCFWEISIAGPEAARYARLVVDGAWSGNESAARQLLMDVANALRPKQRLTCLSTCGAFLRFEWPPELPPRGNPNPTPHELDLLTRGAERAIRAVMREDVLNALWGCCDYLAVGVDTEKEKISTSYNIISQPHAELVGLLNLRTNDIHWTGKFYPTSQQERTIVRFPDLQSHFVRLDGEPVMILGCHDLSIYSPRGQAKAGASKLQLAEEFRNLAKQWRPTVVLQHPHTTVKRRTWEQQWRQLEHEMPFVERYLGAGAYSYRDDGWNSRDDLQQVLTSTQRGDILTVLVRSGVAPNGTNRQ